MQVKFTTNLKGFDLLDEFKPKLAKSYMPEYLKKMPKDNTKAYEIIHKLVPNVRTAKVCPSFIDIYTQSIVLPAPCDIWLKVTDEYGEYRTSNKQIQMDFHINPQFVDYLDNPKSVKGVFKLYYPYYAILPKGYNFKQIPMFYDFNKDWQVAYGQYQADTISEVVCQILFTSENEEVLIKAGEPLCFYLPYKREKVDISFERFDKYENKINADIHRNVSRFLYGHRKGR